MLSAFASAAPGLAQSENQFYDAAALAKEHFVQSLELAAEHHVAKLETKARHFKEAARLDRALYLTRMAHEIDIARREGVRDVWKARNDTAQTLMIVESVFSAFIFEIIVGARIPDDSSERVLAAFSFFLGASLLLSVIGIALLLVVHHRLAQYRFKKPMQRYLPCGKKHREINSYFRCHCARVDTVGKVCFTAAVSLALISCCIYGTSKWRSHFNGDVAAGVLFSVPIGLSVVFVWLGQVVFREDTFHPDDAGEDDDSAYSRHTSIALRGAVSFRSAAADDDDGTDAVAAATGLPPTALRPRPGYSLAEEEEAIGAAALADTMPGPGGYDDDDGGTDVRRSPGQRSGDADGGSPQLQSGRGGARRRGRYEGREPQELLESGLFSKGAGHWGPATGGHRSQSQLDMELPDEILSEGASSSDDRRSPRQWLSMRTLRRDIDAGDDGAASNGIRSDGPASRRGSPRADGSAAASPIIPADEHHTVFDAPTRFVRALRDEQANTDDYDDAALRDLQEGFGLGGDAEPEDHDDGGFSGLRAMAAELRSLQHGSPTITRPSSHLPSPTGRRARAATLAGASPFSFSTDPRSPMIPPARRLSRSQTLSPRQRPQGAATAAGSAREPATDDASPLPRSTYLTVPMPEIRRRGPGRARAATEFEHRPPTAMHRMSSRPPPLELGGDGYLSDDGARAGSSAASADDGFRTPLSHTYSSTGGAATDSDGDRAATARTSHEPFE